MSTIEACRAAFEGHLDACAWCAGQPFNLCEEGTALLEATAAADDLPSHPYREAAPPPPEPVCEACHGDRVVWDGMGTEPCAACGGTGRPQ